jgi:hypothetical protein
MRTWLGFTSDREVWPIPDPVNPDIATIVQLAKPADMATSAMPTGSALWAAGQFVAWAVRAQRLDPRFMLWWLGKAFDPQQRVGYLRLAVEPTHRLFVPIAAATVVPSSGKRG